MRASGSEKGSGRAALNLMLCVLGLTALLTSCTGEGEETPTASLRTVGTELALEERDRWLAKEEAVARCMREQGYQFEPQPLAQVQGNLDWLIAPPIFEGTGYGIAARIPGLAERVQSGTVNSNRDIYLALAPAERAGWLAAYGGNNAHLDIQSMVLLDATTGQPFDLNDARGRDSCLAEALDEVGTIHPLEAFGDEVNGLLERAISDPGLVAAQQGWSGCMLAAGYDYASPIGLVEHLQEQAVFAALDGADPAAMHELESALAIADAECRRSTTYDAVVAASEADLAKELLEILGR